MPDNLNARGVQRELAERLKRIFGEGMVKVEWHSRSCAQDWLKFKSIYAPRPDIAVGPFNTEERRNTEAIKKAFEDKCEEFFEHLRRYDACRGIRRVNFSLNRNPRCLIAVEIENSNKGKHMLGNIVNASLLGKVGMIVILREEFLEAAIRATKYLRCAHEIGKTELRITNVLVCPWHELRSFLTRWNYRVSSRS